MAINPDTKIDAKAEIARRTRRSFMVLGGGAAAGLAGWAALNHGNDAGIPPALRGVLGFNEKLVRGAVYSNDHLVEDVSGVGGREDQSKRRYRAGRRY